MSEYYLRVEGVNLNWFVYDTQDLSTTRCGSQLLNYAIAELAQTVPGLNPVSTGASPGIFAFSDQDPQAVVAKVWEYLENDHRLKHASFVVDAVGQPPDRAAFEETREVLLAKNRWHQMTDPAPNRAIPSTLAGLACRIDGVRLATREVKKGGDL